MKAQRRWTRITLPVLALLLVLLPSGGRAEAALAPPAPAQAGAQAGARDDAGDGIEYETVRISRPDGSVVLLRVPKHLPLQLGRTSVLRRLRTLSDAADGPATAAGGGREAAGPGDSRADAPPSRGYTISLPFRGRQPLDVPGDLPIGRRDFTPNAPVVAGDDPTEWRIGRAWAPDNEHDNSGKNLGHLYSGDFIVLEPGDGWDGPTQEPPPIGDDTMRGYDAKAIARWDVVPYQTITEDFHIGVVAFHINGIEQVLFSVEKGPWVPVKKMQLNPRTGVWEYTVVIRPDMFKKDGLIEVRAVAVPKGAGQPRLLAGPIDGFVAGDPDYRNGNHAMYLNVNARGQLPLREVWADAVNGSDTTGTGTEAAPFKTPAKALASVTKAYGTSDNTVCYLKPGEYSWTPPTYPDKIVTSQAWATVQAADNVNPRDVVFTANAPTGFGTRLLKANRITMDGHGGPRTVGHFDTYFWLDNSLIDGGDQFNGSGPASGSWAGIYVTDSASVNIRTALRSATFVRNASIQNISNTPFGADAMVLNTNVRRFTRHPDGDHADVFHWYWNSPAVRENRVVYGLRVVDFPIQGFQMNSMTGGGQQVDNIAFVNVHITKDLVNAAGSWWSIDSNHVVFNNVQIPDQSVRFQVHSQDDDGELELRNVAFRNCVLIRLAADDGVLEGARFEHVHIMDNGAHGAWNPKAGTDLSFGTRDGGRYLHEVFVSPLDRDYRPKPQSVITGRTPSGKIPETADVAGLELRGSHGSLGAFFASDPSGSE